jgi:hypothetical protein
MKLALALVAGLVFATPAMAAQTAPVPAEGLAVATQDSEWSSQRRVCRTVTTKRRIGNRVVVRRVRECRRGRRWI